MSVFRPSTADSNFSAKSNPSRLACERSAALEASDAWANDSRLTAGRRPRVPLCELVRPLSPDRATGAMVLESPRKYDQRSSRRGWVGVEPDLRHACSFLWNSFGVAEGQIRPPPRRTSRVYRMLAQAAPISVRKGVQPSVLGGSILTRGQLPLLPGRLMLSSFEQGYVLRRH